MKRTIDIPQWLTLAATVRGSKGLGHVSARSNPVVDFDVI